MRWNGSSWAIVPSPEPKGFSRSYLYGLSCPAASECWSVGQASNTAAEEGEGKAAPRAIVERFDGSSWSLASLAEPPAELTDVSCSSQSFCLAVVGEGLEMERYDGKSWSPADSAAAPPGESSAVLNAVSCTSATACTVAGYSYGNESQRPLAEYWDGAEWVIQETTDPHEVLEGALPFGNFQSVSCATASACVAGGSYLDGSAHFNLVAETHAPGVAPTAITESASEITVSSATLNATVNPGGEDTTFRFELGTSTSYGISVPFTGVGIGSGSKDHELSYPMAGLQPGTTYHYRVVAENAAGEAEGEDMALTTPSPPPQPGFGPVFLSGYGLSQGFNVTGGSAYFETPAMAFACSGSTTGSGEIQDEYGGEVVLAYHGCSASGSKFTTPGQTAGTILTSPLKVKPVYLDEANEEVGLLLTAHDSEAFAEFTWWGGLVDFVLSGGLVATFDAPGLYESSSSLDFHSSGFGPWQIEDIGEYHSLSSSTNGGGAEEMAIGATYKATLEDEGELQPHPENPEFIDPQIGGESVSDIGAHKATLNAEIDLNGVPAYYEFQYGTTESYGSRIPVPSKEISAPGDVPVSAHLEGLKKDTTYHYRVVARSEYGKAIGADGEFTTEPEPDTTITSPTPAYTSGAISEVEFSSDTPDVDFLCSLQSDPAYPTDFSEKACESPYELPKLDFEAWHTFTVTAVDDDGNADETPASWKFQTGLYPPAAETSKLTSPEEGEKSGAFATLQAEVENPELRSAVEGVRFQVKVASKDKFEMIPAKYVLDGQGDEVSWPLAIDGETGRTEPVFFNMRKAWALGISSTGSHPAELKFRAVFDGDPSVEGAIGTSKPASLNYSRRWGGSNDAAESVGPATLNLLTGYYTITRTDVSIPVPGFDANLEFSRTYYSGAAGGWIAGAEAETEVLGTNWQPSAPVEAEYPGEAWQRVLVQHQPYVPAKYDSTCQAEQKEIEEELKEFEEWTGPFDPEECLIEYEIPEANWAEVLDNEGAGISFDKQGSSYVAPEEAKEFKLTYNDSEEVFLLVDSNGTHTEFTRNGTTSEYQPHAVWFAGTPSEAKMVYEIVDGKRRLKTIVAPAAVTCNASKSQGSYAPETAGCRSLTFDYKTVYVSQVGTQQLKPVPRLGSITYHNATGSGDEVVAEYEYWGWSNGDGRLREVWDPRVSPALKEKYSYDPEREDSLATLTPPGEKPWEFAYYQSNDWRLKSVSRATLLESEPTATTTIAYDVPLSGSDAPHAMSAASVAEWGQADYPVNATAIFPPTNVPEDPQDPDDYDQATIHYMDPDGYAVNTAAPPPPGVEGEVITTSEVDHRGNVVRGLGPKARLQALGSADPVSRARELDTHSTYSYGENGARLLESQSWGPLHEVRLQSGETVEARSHTSTVYDKGFELDEGETWPQLPTEETTAAAVPGEEAELEPRLTETEYDWKLRKPTREIVDPEGLNLISTTLYNSAGQIKEERQPGNSLGGSAGTTLSVYWTAGDNSEHESCGNNAVLAGLPCLIRPAAEPAPDAGLPKLPWTWFKKYSPLDQPTETEEKTNGVLKRTTTTEYDTAGRQLRAQVSGEGVELPATETLYSSTTGAPTVTRFHCDSETESCAEFDDQATTTTYDALGRPIKYEDADGNVSEVLYDLLSRPVATWDGKGTQEISYDEESGVVSEMTDSAAGTFKATYNADGQMTEQLLPSGLLQKLTYDSTGTPVSLSYEKVFCSTSCTWLSFDREHSIGGQVLSEESTLGDHEYTYDKAGRLTLVKEYGLGGACTTRAYSFDKNTNRTKLITREPGEGGACDTESAGEAQEYDYDTADRLLGEGVQYDNLGRITDLPGKYAGGGDLETTYYVNDLTHSQTQDGITNTYSLDAALRQRERTREGGTEAGTQIYHYAAASDSPAWTEEIDGEETTWTRSIGALGGSLGALQQSNGDITLQLANMHGDTIATADNDPEATELLATQRFDEYGNPLQSGALEGGDPEYGWLGATRRRTQLPSGVIQMGVRSYVPVLGRFLSPDPVKGGSANAYEYAAGDPVNNFDLTGEKLCQRVKHAGRVCANNGKGLQRRVRSTRKRVRSELRALRRANRTGVATVRMQGNALQNFLDRPGFTERLAERAKKLKLKEWRRLQRYGNADGPYKGVDCGELAEGLTYAGVPGFFISAVAGGPIGLVISALPL